MISIEQWHATIGCFVPCAAKCNTSKCIGKVLNRGSTWSHYSIKLFILIMAVLSALLIMAGDVELNSSVVKYKINPEKQKAAYVARYKINPEKQKTASIEKKIRAFKNHL